MDGFTVLANNSNAGNIQVTLENPPRGAASVRLSGTADLFIPMRDPNSLVKVPGFLARPGKPVPSKGLGAAKVEVTVLSKDSYVEELKKDRLDEKKIAAIEVTASGSRVDRYAMAFWARARALAGASMTPDEPEELEVVPWKLADLDQLMLREDFSEGRSLAALFIAREWLRGGA